MTLLVPSFGDTTDSAGAASTTTLSYGDQGAAVRQAQTALNKHGAHLAVDGSFGQQTLAAVKAFQKRNNLTVDGVIGVQTWKALGVSSSSAPTSTSDASLRAFGITQTAIDGARKHGAALDINKSNHKLYFLRSSGNAVSISASSTVSFAGKNKDGRFSTPSGTFNVVRRGGANAWSNTWNAPMPWPLYFTNSGYAVHADPLGPSHGCIHVPDISTMKYINQNTPIGSTVVMHGTLTAAY